MKPRVSGNGPQAAWDNLEILIGNETGMKQIQVLKQGWRFRRTDSDSSAPSLDDSSWERVEVPHDWAIRGPFDSRNDFYSTRIVQDGETTETPHYGRTGGLPHIGVGWYRLRFSLRPEDRGKRIFLEFDGIMSRSTVFVNGKKAGGRPYGYSSFSLEITPLVEWEKENLLAVRVANPEQASRWYPGAGIYREARLLVLEQEHFNWSGIRIWNRTMEPEKARASVDVEVDYAGEECRVELTVADPAGTVVFQSAFSGKQTAFELENLRLWTPETPELYSFQFRLMKNGELRDEQVVAYGFRSVRFDAEKGMFLNGKPYYLKGVCLHHDLGPLGAAFSLPALRRQLRLLKGIGCNAIRTSHNPPDPKLLDLCDSMGFAVMDEAFDAWKEGKIVNDYSSLFPEWHERDLGDMIRRDRNHPCVILWSIGNEINEQGSPDGWKIAKELGEICHRLDPSRPVTAGLDRPDAGIPNHFPESLDIIGWNYKPHRYPEFHKIYPTIPQYGSETASTVSSRGEYFFPVEQGPEWHFHPNTQCSSYDLEFPPWASTPDREFKMQDACPWIFGEFVWTGFDYLGEPTPYNAHWPAHASYFGIFDLVGLPKDRAWLYAARWSGKPVLHLLPHWTWPGREGEQTPVHVYTSYDRVELFVNGKSAGERVRNASEYRLVWNDVVYQPGEIRAVARSASGEAIAEERIVTASAGVKLVIRADRTELRADGEDLGFLTVSVVDKQGTLQPSADHPVRFTVEGEGSFVAAGNGNSISTEDFYCGTMRAFHGQCVGIVRAGKAAGIIRITVSADGLEKAELELPVR